MLWNLLLVLSAVAVKPDRAEDDVSGIELRPFGQDEPDAKPSSSGFRFELHCGSIGSTNCRDAQNSLELIGKTISNDILIRVPITVSVSFVSPSREDRPVLPWSYPVIQKLPVGNQF